METISLTASYDFSMSEFQSGDPTSRAMRTIRHETTHAYQALATPYGYYFTLIKSFQVSRVLQILHQLSDLGEDPRPPLITQITRGRPATRYRQLRVELYAWYLAEVVLMHFEGDQERYERMQLENPVCAGRPIGQLFVELEGFLVQWLRNAGHRVAGGPTESGNVKSQSFAQFIFRVTSPGGGDTVSVLESAAHVSEYWRAWPASLAAFETKLPAWSNYSAWLRIGLQNGLAPDPASFCLTYAALADLALNAPLLPHQSGFRRPDWSILEITPVTRLAFSLNIVAGTRSNRVAPIQDLARDYVPFVEAVCERFDWPTPWEMARFVEPSLPDDTQLDALSQLFRLSQQFRLQVPEAFLDLDVWSVDGPTAKLFRRSFVHPVIQFNDKVLYHHDKELVEYAVVNYVLSEYLRQLMIVGNRPVILPVRAGPADVTVFTEVVAAHLASDVGLHDARLQIVPAPASVNHDS